jgi:hypothetical protein
MQQAKKRSVYKILVVEPEEKEPLGGPKHKEDDNIKMNLKETGCKGVDWIHLVQDREQWRALVNKLMNLRAPYNYGNFLRCSAAVGFLRRAPLHGVSKLITYLISP